MRRILIANRGEIAVRIIQTIKKMGLEAVALYTSSEKDAMHVRLADFSVLLGDGPVTETYLNIARLITSAKENGCDAIHPGYGFLSENYLFAKACEENEINFIGPSGRVIQQMGSKSEARSIVKKIGIPLLEAIEIIGNQLPPADGLQFPVIIKAALGGGGKGMKIVFNSEDLPEAIENARREAISYFSDDKLIIEPYIENARHIEVQILGDNFGKVVHLYERECSIQRNHQKIIEEAPAVSISGDLRKKLHLAAINIAKEIGYTNAGTVEFLVHDNSFYFLEMNTRVQVEHPVTEALIGIDIVFEQIQIANNMPLPEYLDGIVPTGHAIEARICAENPVENFRPSSGKIEFVQFPGNARTDTFIERGTKISPDFDSMLAKLIVHGKTREEAVTNLRNTLRHAIIHGVDTNIAYLSAIAKNNKFISNHISTDFIKIHHQKLISEISHEKQKLSVVLPLAAFVFDRFIKIPEEQVNLWQYAGISRINQNLTIVIDGIEHQLRIVSKNETGIEILVKKEIYKVQVKKEGSNRLIIKIENEFYSGYYTRLKKKTYDVFEINSFQHKIFSPQVLSMAGQFMSKKSESSGKYFNQIVSPLFGKVIDIKVKPKDKVKKGDILLTIESMKTENHILSPGEGIVDEIKVQRGIQVEENFELITLNPSIENEHINN